MRAIMFSYRVYSSIFLVACALFLGRVGEAGVLHSSEIPMADKKNKTTQIHDDVLVDPYYWMREKDHPEVMKHLEAEDGYTQKIMKPTEDFQKQLYEEMLSHIKQTDESVPYKQGRYYYYTRTEQGKQYPISCRKKDSLEAPEEILLDQNALAAGKKFFDVGVFVPSDDGQWLAYSTDITGYRQYTLQIKNLMTGQLSSEKIERVGSAVWASDNRTLFYVTEDAVTKRSDRFFRHVLGEQKSELVYEEKDELYDVSTYRSRDRELIFLGSFSKTTTEIRYLFANQTRAVPQLILPRQTDHEYDVDHYGNYFFIRTNRGAKNFRVVTAPVTDPSEKNWRDFVEYRPKVKIESVDLFARHAVLSVRENGLEQIEIVDIDQNELVAPRFVNRKTQRITFPEPVYSVGLSTNREFDTDVVRYNYQSLTTPSSVFDYDMKTRQAKLLKQKEVPGGFQKENYQAERIFATATDGTQIPMSVVYKRGVKLNGSAPLLLYAYGSYGASMTPSFSTTRLSLLDRGVVYVIAHVRGGGELGEEWREAGRMMNKMNTFTDFIACAEFLIGHRYTSSSRLVIQGGSAGGLLVGAVTNMRPDLFKAVLAQVPFVDVINTMLDASLPLTTSEYIEWGNPNERAAYEYMKKYSPYDNVKRQAYPTMLVKVSVYDSQVPYWEGAKLVAKIREMQTNQNLILLKVNFGAGHGGASGRYDAIKEAAFDQAFLLWQMGLVPPVQ